MNDLKEIHDYISVMKFFKKLRQSFHNYNTARILTCYVCDIDA